MPADQLYVEQRLLLTATITIVRASRCLLGVTQLTFFWTSSLACYAKLVDLRLTNIGMYLHGFEKHILPDINKRSSLGERWEQAEA